MHPNGSTKVLPFQDAAKAFGHSSNDAPGMHPVRVLPGAIHIHRRRPVVLAVLPTFAALLTPPTAVAPPPPRAPLPDRAVAP